PARRGATKPPPCPRQRDCSQCRGYRRWQARGELAYSKRTEGRGGRPIVQNGFLKPGLTVKPGSDPVAALGHFTRDGSVARLVGADQTQDTEVAEQASVEDQGDQQRSPERNGNTRRLGGRRARWRLSMQIAFSLTFRPTGVSRTRAPWAPPEPRKAPCLETICSAFGGLGLRPETIT